MPAAPNIQDRARVFSYADLGESAATKSNAPAPMMILAVPIASEELPFGAKAAAVPVVPKQRAESKTRIRDRTRSP